MKSFGALIDGISGNAWIKRLLAIAAILGALAVVASFPGKMSDLWDSVFLEEPLSIAHLDELSSTARVGGGAKGLGRKDTMYWSLAFSILNHGAEVVSIEKITVKLPTAMADLEGNRIWIDSGDPYRHLFTAAKTVPALTALVRGETPEAEADKQALPIALSGGEKLYMFNEMSFNLPVGYGFRRCATKSDCHNLLIRALGSVAVEGGGWRCPHSQFEMSVETRDHGESTISGSSIILIEGCTLFTSPTN